MSVWSNSPSWIRAATVLTVGLAVHTSALAAELGVVLGQVEKKYENVQVIQADFVQTTKNVMFGDEKQQGDVVLKRPSMMKWNFSGERQFVTNGQTMWIYTKADNQVIQYDNVAQGASVADSLLQSLDKLSELFDVTAPAATGPDVTLELKPKGQKAETAQFKKLTLTLGQDLVMKRVEIVDQFDNVTDLSFANVKLDGQIPDSTFSFAIPAGASVIKSGGI